MVATIANERCPHGRRLEHLCPQCNQPDTESKSDPAMRPLFGSPADMTFFKVEPGRLPERATIRRLARVAVERPAADLSLWRVVGEPEACDPDEWVNTEDDEDGAQIKMTLAEQLIAEGVIVDHDPIRYQPYRALVELWGEFYLVDWGDGAVDLWPSEPHAGRRALPPASGQRWTMRLARSQAQTGGARLVKTTALAVGGVG